MSTQKTEVVASSSTSNGRSVRERCPNRPRISHRDYLRARLRDPARRKTATGWIEKGAAKPATVHQEFRVLRRTLNVAVRKKSIRANPCAGVEFPVAVKGLFRPHYASWSE